MRRFAEDTSVSVGNSRGEIDGLLRNWGCDGIAWLDDFKAGRVEGSRNSSRRPQTAY